MESALQNIVPQAGIINKEENPAIDSDRVKASVVDAGSTDFGRSQKHDVANQAGVEEVDRLAPTASKKTSEEEEDNQSIAEAAAFRALRTKVESLMDFILGKTNLHKELKNMARSTNRVLTELAKLRQSPKPKKIVSSNKDGSNQMSPHFHKGKAIQENSKREGKTPPETPRQKKAKRRKEVPSSATPIWNLAKDPPWMTVVKRGIRKEAKKPKNDGTEKTVLAHITTGPRPARPDAFKIKKCGQSMYLMS